VVSLFLDSVEMTGSAALRCFAKRAAWFAFTGVCCCLAARGLDDLSQAGLAGLMHTPSKLIKTRRAATCTTSGSLDALQIYA